MLHFFLVQPLFAATSSWFSHDMEGCMCVIELGVLWASCWLHTSI